VQEFTATIGNLGVNPYLTVPESVSAVFGRRGNIPVKGTIDAAYMFFRQIRPEGRWILWLQDSNGALIGTDSKM